jgi:4'-phosphopantetheinyl transferase
MRSEVEMWQTATAELTFPTDRIDIWRVRLDPAELPEQDLGGILARDEVARACRFHFEDDRRQYIKRRSALRILLGRYLEMSPDEICFRYENNGKPEIATPQDSRGLRFNVSHSGGLALIAVVGSGRGIGVDVEMIRPRLDFLDIAKHFFSAREVQAILKVCENKRQEAFIACWTRKEAFLKATGVGMSYSLSEFSVTVDPIGPAGLCEVSENSDIVNRWFLADVLPGEGYRGALACEGGCCRIEQRVFDL